MICSQAHMVRKGGVPASNVKTYDRLWRRYLSAFDEVVVLARVFDVEDPEAEPAGGPGVTVVEIPGFRSTREALRIAPRMLGAIRDAYADDCAYILRTPSVISDLMWRRLRARRHPYAIELAGDPYDAYAGEGSWRPTRGLVRWYFTQQARLQCAGACAVAYCSQVQRQRYPLRPGAFETFYSQLVLPDEDIVAQPRPAPKPGRISLVSVGMLERMYKAPDVAVDAMAECVRRGLDLELVWVGGGRHLEEMRRRAADRGVADRVHFLGNVQAGQGVIARLDAADVFVFPSRTEGLPKAVGEAMARGLPCIASSVGGIPELLAGEDLVPPNDAMALADKIAEVVASPERMERMAARNLAAAKNYRDAVTDARRAALYEYVRERTQEWLRMRK
ncbi:MAG TPA: glycosyltransferase [Armatimonadota bacterium]|nr:glycosyltransferase [Armatimonadota bacterium]